MTVPQPNSVLVLSIDQVKNDVGGTGNGFIQITPAGGTPPYSFVWIKDGQVFATTEDLAGIFAGQYFVTTTDAHGCVISSNVLTVQTTVSVDETAPDGLFKIYPNPTSGAVFLDFEKSTTGIFSADIFDATGKMVARQTNLEGSKNVRLDLSNCPDGMLLLRVSGDFATLQRRVLKVGQ